MDGEIYCVRAGWSKYSPQGAEGYPLEGEEVVFIEFSGHSPSVRIRFLNPGVEQYFQKIYRNNGHVWWWRKGDFEEVS